MSTMLDDDVKSPEYIGDGLTPDGRPQKVPFLFQRRDETWDEFCARMARVSNSLNNEPAGFSIKQLIVFGMLGMLGLALWCLFVWMLVRFILSLV